jgi:FSR family fosmidomycin resistance protein-like MFS transporter
MGQDRGRAAVGHHEAGRRGGGTAFAVLVALSVTHLLNDTIQSLIAAVYPVLKEQGGLKIDLGGKGG